MKLSQRAIKVGLMLCASLMLSNCQGLGSGTKQVTCETMKFVWLSRKDTAPTIKQVSGNNGAWVALCGNPGPAPKTF